MPQLPLQIKKNQFDPEQEVIVLKLSITDLERQIGVIKKNHTDIAKDIREIKLFCNKIFKNNKHASDMRTVTEPKKNGSHI